MVKIILEVSEDLINEKAKAENVTSSINSDEKGASVMMKLFETIAFSQLKKRVEDGETEFTVAADGQDEKMKMLYDHVIGDACLLASFPKEEKQ